MADHSLTCCHCVFPNNFIDSFNIRSGVLNDSIETHSITMYSSTAINTSRSIDDCILNFDRILALSPLFYAPFPYDHYLISGILFIDYPFFAYKVFDIHGYLFSINYLIGLSINKFIFHVVREHIVFSVLSFLKENLIQIETIQSSEKIYQKDPLQKNTVETQSSLKLPVFSLPSIPSWESLSSIMLKTKSKYCLLSLYNEHYYSSNIEKIICNEIILRYFRR